MSTRISLCFLILLCLSKQLYAQILNLDSIETSTRLGDFASVLRDPNHELTIQDLSKPIAISSFENEGSMGKAFDPSTFWFRVVLSSEEIDAKWIIECPNVLLDSLTFYHSSYTDSLVSGMLIPMEERPVKGSTIAFEFSPTGTVDTIFLRSRSSTLSEVPLRIVKLDSYVLAQTKKNVFYGVVLGIFSLAILLLLIIFLAKKEKVFLLLALYTITAAWNNSHFGGVSFFWYPNDLFFLKWITHIQVEISFILIIWYSQIILDLKNLYPRSYPYFKYIYALPVLLLIATFTLERHVSVLLHSLFPQIIILSFGVWGIICFRKGNRNALLYSLGWLFNIIFLIPYLLDNFGILKSSLFTENSGAIGLLIELAFFTAASTKYFTQKTHEREVKMMRQTQEISQVKAQISNYLKNSKKLSESSLEIVDSEILTKLSEREFEIIQKLLEGKSNPVIAEETFVSVNTVKTHIKSIYAKLGVHNRVELVRKLAGTS